MLLENVGPLLLENETDSVLVDFAVAGNTSAFTVLVRRYQPLMRAHALRTLGSNADADDVVQDAFITAWGKLSTLHDGTHFKAWVMRVVLNKSIDRLRRIGPVPIQINDDTPAIPGSGPFTVVELLLENQALTSAAARLPIPQRRAWEMREFSGYSYWAIAGELEVPVSTVRGLLARSRKTLAAELAAWH